VTPSEFPPMSCRSRVRDRHGDGLAIEQFGTHAGCCVPHIQIFDDEFLAGFLILSVFPGATFLVNSVFNVVSQHIEVALAIGLTFISSGTYNPLPVGCNILIQREK
jgi:hypothetical protein